MIGDRDWMNLTQGKLSFKDKVVMMKTVMFPATLGFIQSKLTSFIPDHSKTQNNLSMQDIRIPDTAIVKDALFELEQTHDQDVILHSWRCYFWGVAFAQIKQWQFDDESFLIASLMHDLGLTDRKTEYQQCQCFSFESALRSESLCERHNFPVYKTQIISDAICLHMNGHLDENDYSLSKETLLLQQATAYDVIGTQAELISKPYNFEILKHYPKHQFKTHFQDLIAQEAKRHPQARTALLNALGLKLMIQFN